MHESRLESFKQWYRDLPEKKRYLEFLSAGLTIPVMVTVLITNTLNLQKQNKQVDVTPSPTASAPTIVLVQPDATIIPSSIPSAIPEASATPLAISQTASPVPVPECKKGIGPVHIEYPQENELVTVDPVSVNMVRESSEYCSIVWSYRINNGAWSEYVDKSISIYGLKPGEKKLQLKVKSVVTNEELLLERNFVVDGISPSPEASSSATSI